MNEWLIETYSQNGRPKGTMALDRTTLFTVKR